MAQRSGPQSSAILPGSQGSSSSSARLTEPPEISISLRRQASRSRRGDRVPGGSYSTAGPRERPTPASCSAACFIFTLHIQTRSRRQTLNVHVPGAVHSKAVLRNINTAWEFDESPLPQSTVLFCMTSESAQPMYPCIRPMLAVLPYTSTILCEYHIILIECPAADPLS